jgi:hypothetical protein
LAAAEDKKTAAQTVTTAVENTVPKQPPEEHLPVGQKQGGEAKEPTADNPGGKESPLLTNQRRGLMLISSRRKHRNN